MNEPLMKYIQHLAKPYQVSSLSANVSLASEEYVHTIDFEYIHALQTFENGLFEVKFYLKETLEFYPYEQIYLQVRHASFTYLFRVRKVIHEERLKRKLEINLIDIKGLNGEVVFELNHRQKLSRRKLPIEKISFVSEKFRTFMAQYHHLPKSLILYDLDLAHIIGDIHGEYADEFYRSDYEERKNEQEIWGNLHEF